jgi:hypothetical protein
MNNDELDKKKYTTKDILTAITLDVREMTRNAHEPKRKLLKA